MRDRGKHGRSDRLLDRLDRVMHGLQKNRGAIPVAGPAGITFLGAEPTWRDLVSQTEAELAAEEDALRISVEVLTSCPVDRALHGRELTVRVLPDDWCKLDFDDHGSRNVKLLKRRDPDSGRRILRVE